MPTAITRDISPSFTRCLLTHLEREPIDVSRARAQHERYRGLLAELGYAVINLPAAEAHPDSVFVEDTAVVVEELAVLARPGARARREEVTDVAEVLASRRRCARIESPGTLDGGDVLRIGRRVFVGRTPRTNAVGAAQLEQHLSPFGYTVTIVEPAGCLHLKSAVTAVGPRQVLLNPDWVDRAIFAGLEIIEVDPTEPAAANTLLLGDTVVAAAAFPGTRGRLEEAGVVCHTLDADEVAKAEGGLTCCSLLLDPR